MKNWNKDSREEQIRQHQELLAIAERFMDLYESGKLDNLTYSEISTSPKLVCIIKFDYVLTISILYS